MNDAAVNTATQINKSRALQTNTLLHASIQKVITPKDPFVFIPSN